MDDWRPACPDCGGILCREMGCLHRCAQCQRLFSVTGDYAEPMGSNWNLSAPDDCRADAALRRRGA